MRIVHVSSSLKRGGAEAVLVSLLTHPLFEAHEHHVIYFHDGPLKELLQKKNIRLHHIAYGPLFFFRFLYQIYAINPDGIHALLWFAMATSSVAGFLLRIPVMIVFHNNIDQNAWYKNWCDAVLLRLASRYVAVSEPVAQSVCHYHRWLSLDRIAVVHNGIDMPAHDYAAQREKWRAMQKIHPATVVIGSVGRFEAVKRYPWLIDRFAEIAPIEKNVLLILAGVGSQEQMLRDYVVEKGVAQYVRFIINQDAYMIYPSFDIFTLTSEKEGISIALLEAMSYARACLITNSQQGHSVIVDEINGRVVGANDKKRFNVILSCLIKEQKTRQKMGEQAFATVRNSFSRDRMVEHYIKQLEYSSNRCTHG